MNVGWTERSHTTSKTKACRSGGFANYVTQLRTFVGKSTKTVAQPHRGTARGPVESYSTYFVVTAPVHERKNTIHIIKPFHQMHVQKARQQWCAASNLTIVNTCQIGGHDVPFASASIYFCRSSAVTAPKMISISSRLRPIVSGISLTHKSLALQKRKERTKKTPP